MGYYGPSATIGVFPVQFSKVLILLFLILSPHAVADEILVAVASNFLKPMEELTRAFQEESGHRLRVASGSSGKLYAQIRNGAPYELFFSADAEKPGALVADGLAEAYSLFTYAVGRLVLWSPDPALIDGPQALESGGFRRLAIANPRIAPYGEAAASVLKQLGLWQSLQGKLVQGESITQAFQFVHSGNAQLGFVALSQIRGEGGSAWRVPADLHGEIKQDAVLLTRGAESTAARQFLDFVRGPRASSIIESHGYDLFATEE